MPWRLQESLAFKMFGQPVNLRLKSCSKAINYVQVPSFFQCLSMLFNVFSMTLNDFECFCNDVQCDF